MDPEIAPHASRDFTSHGLDTRFLAHCCYIHYGPEALGRRPAHTGSGRGAAASMSLSYLHRSSPDRLVIPEPKAQADRGVGQLSAWLDILGTRRDSSDKKPLASMWSSACCCCQYHRGCVQ